MHIMSHLLGIFVILEATQKERLTILTIKAIVVDMDGTFLNEEKAYDRERFLRLKEMMNERGMHFVVASGNQYDRLIEYFPDLEKTYFILPIMVLMFVIMETYSQVRHCHKRFILS